MDTMAQQSTDNTESAPKPPSALSLINIILVLLVTAVGGLGITSLFSQYFADQEMVHASYPFSQSRIMMMSYPPIQKHLGSKLIATDTGTSSVHWNFPNAGSAEISLQLAGANGTGYARLGWNRIAGKWHLLSARWVDSKGIKHDIPMGPKGRFLNAVELEEYRRADPVTPIGRGHRALLEGRTKAAFSEFSDVLNEHPQHVDALVGRGKTHLQNNDVDQAIKDFEQALMLQPAHIEANRALAQIEAQKTANDDVP